MGNSKLVSYTKISPCKTRGRNHKIDTITIHCVVGQLTVEQLGNIFKNTKNKASSNYGIGSDGRIGLYVNETDRSWCSSNKANDNRAVTIECASDKTHPYAINDDVYNSLIDLCVDVCKRNKIKQLLWKADKNLIGQTNKQNITVHRWFANKECPGDYIYNKLWQIADDVNKRLDAETSSTDYKVKIKVSKLNIRTGPGITNRKVGTVKKNEVYTITSTKNGWGYLKSGAGWISLKYTEHYD